MGFGISAWLYPPFPASCAFPYTMPPIPVEQRLHAFAKQRYPFPSNTERWKLEAD